MGAKPSFACFLSSLSDSPMFALVLKPGPPGATDIDPSSRLLSPSLRPRPEGQPQGLVSPASVGAFLGASPFLGHVSAGLRLGSSSFPPSPPLLCLSEHLHKPGRERCTWRVFIHFTANWDLETLEAGFFTLCSSPAPSG